MKSERKEELELGELERRNEEEGREEIGESSLLMSSKPEAVESHRGLSFIAFFYGFKFEETIQCLLGDLK